MDTQTIADRRGEEVLDRDGDKIGKLEEIYLDQQSGQPEWALVKTGLFGSASTFVPLANAQSEGDGLRVAFQKDQVKDAPKIETGHELSPQEEAELYRFYGLDYGGGEQPGTNGTGDAHAQAGGPGHDTSGPNTDEAMTRSEEELAVGKTQREAGRVRLRKFVVTENVETSVPVQREEVRVEREPITDANRDAALSGPDISEEEHEVTLHSEEPVVEKEVVPKERVRLEKDTVTEERGVSEEVRKERIESEGDAGRDRF